MPPSRAERDVAVKRAAEAAEASRCCPDSPWSTCSLRSWCGQVRPSGGARGVRHLTVPAASKSRCGTHILHEAQAGCCRGRTAGPRSNQGGRCARRSTGRRWTGTGRPGGGRQEVVASRGLVDRYRTWGGMGSTCRKPPRCCSTGRRWTGERGTRPADRGTAGWLTFMLLILVDGIRRCMMSNAA